MIRRDGRWGGRVTSRPLLDGDSTLDLLADEARRELAGVWLARAATCTAVRELVSPGLERLALPTAKIRTWLDAGAPT